VTMAEPIEQSIFLDAHIEIDADLKKSTGFDGFDFGVHAFVGSRYRRSTAQKDGIAPLAHRRTIVKFAKDAQPGSGGWIHSNQHLLAPPKVKGKLLQFRFPLELLRTYGLRYNKKIRWRLFTESTISEHPLATEYICGQDALTIGIDGQVGDWPPIGVLVRDKKGDLHPDTTEVDITALQVEHDAKAVYALVRLARAGFGAAQPEDDIQDRDRIVVCLEPVGARAYMKFVQANVSTMPNSSFESDGTFTYRAGQRFVEFAFPRKPEQTKFRVLAYADAERVDSVPDEGPRILTIPTKAWATK